MSIHLIPVFTSCPTLVKPDEDSLFTLYVVVLVSHTATVVQVSITINIITMITTQGYVCRIQSHGVSQRGAHTTISMNFPVLI